MQGSQKEDHAGDLKKAEIIFGLRLPSSRDAARAFEPSKKALDLPSALVPTELSPVLHAVALGSAAPLRGDEIDASLARQSVTQRAAVPGLVSDQSWRKLSYESSVESSLGEHTVESVSSVNMQSERKTIAVCHCHDLGRLSGAANTDTRPPFFAGA